MTATFTLGRRINNIVSRLGRIPSRQWMLNDGSLQLQRAGKGKTIIILARSLCQFMCINLTKIPSSSRRGMMDLQVRKESPFERTGHVMVWQAQHTLVWSWDLQRVEDALRAADIDPHKVVCIPESLFYPADEQGLRLLACQEGFEGQFWSDSVLMHSRWWSNPPSPHEWALFQRDIGVTPLQTLSTATTMHLSDQTWAKVTINRDHLDSSMQIERMAYASALLVLAALTLDFTAAWLHAIHETNQQSRILNTLRRQISPLIEAREHALSDQDRIESLERLYPSTLPLELMAAVAQSMPVHRAYLQEWDMQGQKLRLTLAPMEGDLSATAILRSLNSTGLFSNIEGVSSPNEAILTLKLDVTPSHE
ncbi:MAG: hypothetical protein HKM02_03885 [Pseudomonadales bacterium]|nr:hypothetical protein [Pseudomonadales bacterium]